MKPSGDDGIVHTTDGLRDKTQTESFTITKGKGTVHCYFEDRPIWLAVLPSMSFRSTCFPQYNDFNHLLNVNNITNIFVTSFLTSWPRDKVKFKSYDLEDPNIILISGSFWFVNHLDIDHFDAPTIAAVEGKRQKVLNNGYLFKTHRNCFNGGCLDVRSMVGHKNIDPPTTITMISRTLGDFLEYSVHPNHSVKVGGADASDVLTKESVLSIASLNKQVLMPTFRLATGWGKRCLTRKELFSIWGLLSLESTSMSIQQLKSVVPIQPLSLILNAYVLQPSHHVRKSVPVSVQDHFDAPSTSTTFSSINTTISNDWIDQSLLITSRKEDKATIPTWLWDKRIIDSFPSRNTEPLILALRTLCLLQYRKSLTRSYLMCLRSTFPIEWTLYCSGKRSHMEGGEFCEFF